MFNCAWFFCHAEDDDFSNCNAQHNNGGLTFCPADAYKNVLVISTVRDCFEGLSIADEMLNQCTAKNSPNILNKLRYSGYSSVHLKVNQVYETFSSPFQTKITEFSKKHIFCYSIQKENRKSLCFLLL